MLFIAYFTFKIQCSVAKFQRFHLTKIDCMLKTNCTLQPVCYLNKINFDIPLISGVLKKFFLVEANHFEKVKTYFWTPTFQNQEFRSFGPNK